MKNVKLIASDLDGTALLDGRLSDINKEAIEKAIGSGIEFAVSTGRGLSAVPGAILEMEGFRYAITSNGACLVDVKTGERLRHFTLEETDARELQRIGAEYNLALELFIEGIPYVTKDYHDDPLRFGQNERILPYIKASRKPVDNYEEFVLEHIGEIENFAFVTPNSEIHDRIVEEVEKRCPNTLLVISEPQWVEVMNIQAGKGKGVKQLADYLGIPMENVAAFGDGDNDIEMLEMAGHSFAMGNGSQGCRQAARYVTLCVEENGLAEGIEEILKKI